MFGHCAPPGQLNVANTHLFATLTATPWAFNRQEASDLSIWRFSDPNFRFGTITHISRVSHSLSCSRAHPPPSSPPVEVVFDDLGKGYFGFPAFTAPGANRSPK